MRSLWKVFKTLGEREQQKLDRKANRNAYQADMPFRLAFVMLFRKETDCIDSSANVRNVLVLR